MAAVTAYGDRMIAVERSLRHLQRSLGDAGWTDFTGSDEWVTCWAAAHLALVPEFEPSAALTAALRRMPGTKPGLAYNGQGTPDCDSTSWYLLACRNVGCLTPQARRRAVRFLEAHHDPASGGFVTYRRDTPGASRLLQPERAAWFAPQPCVTAVAAFALSWLGLPRTTWMENAAAAYLRAVRMESGLWPSYWWQGETYTTFFATSFLRRVGALQARDTGEIHDALLRRRAADGGWGAADGPSTALHTGLALATLLIDPAPARARTIDDVGRFLLGRAHDDGSFGGEPVLRVPHAELGRTALWSDRRRVFTTAFVCRVLARWRDLGPALAARGAAA